MAVTRLVLEYDGTDFAGWARQPQVRTVQGVVEAAIARLRGGRAVDLTVAGRTDRGVHAWGQVASYPDEPVPVRGLNALLPGDVTARECVAAPEGFDARRDATSRTYCYRIHDEPVRPALDRARALHWPHRLEVAALEACAAALCGTHDFTAFTPTVTDHVRFDRDVLRAAWLRRDGFLEFWIEADAFMRHMNRTLVGTMLEVAGGRRSVEDFKRLLEGAPRAAAGPTAPAHGLYFAGVAY